VGKCEYVGKRIGLFVTRLCFTLSTDLTAIIEQLFLKG